MTLLEKNSYSKDGFVWTWSEVLMFTSNHLRWIFASILLSLSDMWLTSFTNFSKLSFCALASSIVSSTATHIAIDLSISLYHLCHNRCHQNDSKEVIPDVALYFFEHRRSTLLPVKLGTPQWSSQLPRCWRELMLCQWKNSKKKFMAAEKLVTR